MEASLTTLFSDPFVARGLTALIVKATVLVGLGLVAAHLLRRESAARRHLALALVLGGLVALPVLEVVVPAWYAGQQVKHLHGKVIGATDATPTLAPLPPAPPEPPVPPDAPLAPEAPAAPEPPLAPEAPPAPALADADGAVLAPVALAAPSTGGRDGGAQGGLPVMSLLLGLWLAGSLVAALYFALGRLRVLRWGRTSPEVDDAAAQTAAREIVRTLGIRRPVRLVWADAATPMTWGVFRPVVALPFEARAWSPERLRIVLMHELTHVARFDALTQAFAHVACTLFWFHPLVWMAAHRLTQERELACDDAVLERGARASSYAQHLLDVAKGLRRPQAVPVAALAMARRGELEGRLCAILATGRRRGGLRRVHAFLASLLVVVLVLPLAAFKPWDAPLKTKATEKIKEVFANSALMERAAALVGLEAAPKLSESFMVMADDAHCVGNVRPGGTFTLRTDVGSIEVRPWDRSTVEVTLDQNIGERFRSTCRITGGNATVEGRLDRSNRWNWGRNQRVRYIVRVPSRFNLDVNTSGGSISTGDLEGRVAIRTSGGSLSMGDIKGVVQANTSGGSISLERASGNARLETSGGSVSVGPVGGDLYVHTSGGSVSLDGGASGSIDASTSGGTVEAVLARQPRGDVRLSTSGGSVRVGLANGLRFNVDASASAGRVRSDFHTGRATESLRDEIGGGGPLLRLRTSAGNIQISRAGRMSLNYTRPRIDVDPDVNVDVALSESDVRRIERDLQNLDVEIGDVDVHFDEGFEVEINAAVREGLREAQRELKRVQPEIDRALAEALPQAQRELQRALRETSRERARALQEADRERAEALREAERDLQEALRELGQDKRTNSRDRAEALRESRRAHEEALREAEAYRREALREAEQERQEALREAEQERQETLRDVREARREALREQQEAQREAQRDREEAQREREEARRERERERVRNRSGRVGMVAVVAPTPAVMVTPAVAKVHIVKKAPCPDTLPTAVAVATAPRATAVAVAVQR